MSATDIISEIHSLPHDERLEVIGKVLANESNEDVESALRKRRLAGFDELCALMDRSAHLGRQMTEEEIIGLALRA